MSKSLPPSRTAPQFVVRFPDDTMRDRIKRDADERGRSMNAQIVYMLQSYFEQLDKGVSELQEAMDSGLLESLGSPETNAALVKVLRFHERQILMARVSRLGGTDGVLAMPKADLVKKIDGEEITRTASEAESYYSKTVGQTPLTAVLTTEEIEALARRIVQVQQVHLQVATKAEYPNPDHTVEDAVNGPPSDDPAVLEKQMSRRPDDPAVWLKAGENEAEQRNFDKAAEYLHRVLALSRSRSPQSKAAQKMLDQIRSKNKRQHATKNSRP